MYDVKKEAQDQIERMISIEYVKSAKHEEIEDNLYKCTAYVVLEGDTKEDDYRLEEDQLTKVVFNYKVTDDNKVKIFNFIQY